MDPILRRSVVLYLTHVMTWSGILGRFLVTRDWPAFEVIPLFVPVWLASSVLFSDREESYAFLRTLPVTDRRIARTKFGLILGAGALYWLLLMLAVFVRWDGDRTGSAALVYLTVVAACSPLVAAGVQILFWRFGPSIATPLVVVALGVSLVLIIVHTASLGHAAGWPVLMQAAWIGRLAGAPWLSVPAIAAAAVLAFLGLMRAGVRVKASSEACL